MQVVQPLQHLLKDRGYTGFIQDTGFVFSFGHNVLYNIQNRAQREELKSIELEEFIHSLVYNYFIYKSNEFTGKGWSSGQDQSQQVKPEPRRGAARHGGM